MTYEPPEPPGTGMTARNLADYIDELIKQRIVQALNRYDGEPDDVDLEEDCELLIRDIADALQERDPRKGVTVPADAQKRS